jgi:hypothetical protein
VVGRCRYLDQPCPACGRARYRGLAKIHPDHTTAATALNLIRTNAWWNGHPLDRANHSHLARLELTLTA